MALTWILSAGVTLVTKRSGEELMEFGAKDSVKFIPHVVKLNKYGAMVMPPLVKEPNIQTSRQAYG